MVTRKTAGLRSAERRRGGRPKADEVEQRLDVLLDVATKVFVRDGYAGTSIAKIAREAGVSNKTIYARYSNKDALLLAVGLRLTTPSLASLDRVHADPMAGPATVLRAYAWNAATHWTSPTEIALCRSVYAECVRFPPLADIFRATIVRHEERLSAYLALQMKLGALPPDDPMELGCQFLQLATGVLRNRALLGDIPTKAELTRNIDRAVAMMMRLFRDGAAES